MRDDWLWLVLMGLAAVCVGLCAWSSWFVVPGLVLIAGAFLSDHKEKVR